MRLSIVCASVGWRHPARALVVCGRGSLRWLRLVVLLDVSGGAFAPCGCRAGLYGAVLAIGHQRFGCRLRRSDPEFGCAPRAARRVGRIWRHVGVEAGRRIAAFLWVNGVANARLGARGGMSR